MQRLSWRLYLTIILLSESWVVPSFASFKEPLESYTIQINDGDFTPAEIFVLQKKRFRLCLNNVGKSPAEFENLSMRVEKVLSPKVSSNLILPPFRVGTYEFIDEFHPEKKPFKINVK